MGKTQDEQVAPEENGSLTCIYNFRYHLVEPGWIGDRRGVLISPQQFSDGADVVVVGAGITGLAHALAAVRRGLSVIVIERDVRAVGASVRNFGHCCVTAQEGELRELAEAARPLWIDTADRVGFALRQSGAVVVTRTEREQAVIEEMAAGRDRDQVQLLSADTVARVLSNASVPGPAGVVGGALLADDLQVDPRGTAGEIAAWLAEQRGVRFLWQTSALGFGDGVVHTSRGDVAAGHTIVSVGHDLDYLMPELARSHEVERCALHMHLVRAPEGLELEPVILSGTSLLRYDAFSETRAAAALQEEIARTAPALFEIGANVMMVQRSDGSLMIGDSHEYGAGHGPFLAEATARLLLAAAAELLGVPELRVVERWQGVYAASTLRPVLVARVGPTTTAVSVTSGVGMTISMGLGERTIRELY